MERTFNSNEKLARVASGLESNASHFNVDVTGSDDLYKTEAVNAHNQKVDEYVDKLNSHTQQLEEYAKQFNNTVNDLEIKAISNNIIVYPFEKNPFQHIQTNEQGLIIDLGGMAPEYKSNETGEYEEEEQFIHVGTVMDAGPDCKYIKDGDIIMWTKPSEMPIPFYRQNLVSVNEIRVLCVINSNLTERFNKYKNDGKQ